MDELPNKPLKINRALISVSDKSGITPLAECLAAAGVEIISTGGTAEKLRESNIPVRDVAEITGFEECLGGRVKTLHPAVHAGILARTTHQADVDELKRRKIQPIELVVANLYPFQETIERDDCTPALAMENIDIGGPTMIRAAAKNFAHVTVLTNANQYEEFISHFEENKSIDFSYRREWARQAFNHTAEYDVFIANYFNDLADDKSPYRLNISLPKSRELRYGENPHQQAAVYGNQNEIIRCFHGKQLSYNNFMDIDAALNLIEDFEAEEPTCAIFKHTVPCGVASAGSLYAAWKKAFATDTSSPYGGIIVVNKALDLETASVIDEIFTEIIIAPSFSSRAKKLLQQKKNRRLIRIKKAKNGLPKRSFRSIFGGALSQTTDQAVADFENFETVTHRKPTEDEKKDLLFAWKVVKHVKSNGIVYAKEKQTIGIGTGQTSRIESSQIAISKAGEQGLKTEDTALASDAFFPFADNIEIAAKAGATAVIQPGGSIRDEEVIKEANRQNMVMIFTGNRHFRH